MASKNTKATPPKPMKNRTGAGGSKPARPTAGQMMTGGSHRMAGGHMMGDAEMAAMMGKGKKKGR